MDDQFLKAMKMMMSGGERMTKEWLINHQQGSIAFMKAAEGTVQLQKIKMSGGDAISKANLCTKPISELREVNLSNCEVGKIQKDSIIWLKTITDPAKPGSVSLITEDKTGECVMLNTYNHVDSNINFQQLTEVFPKGVIIGLKNPYMKVSAAGTINLRNDNPQNIVFKEEKKDDALILKELGNKFFSEKQFVQAIKCYQDAMQKTSEDDLKMILFSNTSQNYLELQMYEDALENAEEALKFQKDHRKSLLRKASALAFLYEFEQS